MEKIIIEVPLEGNVKISVDGIKGSACKDLTAAIERALGKVTSDTATKEMHERPVNQTITQH